MIGPQTQVTNENGNYRFPAVPPGIYSVTFELAGFSSVKREGIRVTLGFTANVNVELALASLQETVTVTGESPVIDTSATRVQQNFKLEQLNGIPNGRDMWALLAATPSVSVMTPHRRRRQPRRHADRLHAPTASTARCACSVEGINTTEGTGGAGFYFDYGSFEEVFLGVDRSGRRDAPRLACSRSSSASRAATDFHGEFYVDWVQQLVPGLEPAGRVHHADGWNNGSDSRRQQRECCATTTSTSTSADRSSATRPGATSHLAQAVQRVEQPHFNFDQTFDTTLEHEPVGEGHLSGQPEPQVHRLLPVEHEDSADPSAVRAATPTTASEPTYATGVAELGVQGRMERHAQRQAVPRSALRRLRLLRFPLITNSDEDYFWRDTGRAGL